MRKMKKVKPFEVLPCLNNTYYICGNCRKYISLYLISKYHLKNCPQCEMELKQHGIAKLQDIMHRKRREILTQKALERKMKQELEENQEEKE